MRLFNMAGIATLLYGLFGKKKEENPYGDTDRMPGRNIAAASLVALLTASTQSNVSVYSPSPDLESPRQYAAQFNTSRKTESFSNQRPTYLTNSGFVKEYNLKAGSKIYRGIDDEGKEITLYFNVNDEQIRLRDVKTKRFVSSKRIANLREI